MEMPITTTSGFEGKMIKQYLGVIIASKVARTGFFVDLAAAFSDSFSGFSETYQGELEALKNAVISDLIEEAKKKKANAIIGLRIDFDEIAGKGKQMFMATALGTAVKLETGMMSDQSVDIDELLIAEKRILLLNQLHTKKISTRDRVDEIVELDAKEAVPLIIEDFIFDVDYPRYFSNSAIDYFMLFNPDDIARIFTHNMVREEKRGYLIHECTKLMCQLKCGSFSLAILLLRSNQFAERRIALYLLTVPKREYKKSDIEEMKAVIEMLKVSFPQIVEIAGGKWRCICGKWNPDRDFKCKGCKRDLRGLNEDDPTPEALIADLSLKANALIQLLSYQNN